MKILEIKTIFLQKKKLSFIFDVLFRSRRQLLLVSHRWFQNCYCYYYYLSKELQLVRVLATLRRRFLRSAQCWNLRKTTTKTNHCQTTLPCLKAVEVHCCRYLLCLRKCRLVVAVAELDSLVARRQTSSRNLTKKLLQYCMCLSHCHLLVSLETL